MPSADSVPKAKPTPTTESRPWRGRLICGGLLAIAVAAVALVAVMPAAEVPTPPVRLVPVNVKVWRVKVLAELADTFELSGVVEPNVIVRVAAEVPGRIESFARRQTEIAWRGRPIPKGTVLEEGDPVFAGEPIAYLNKDLLQARHERGAAQFEYDEREFRRVQDLFERGSTSRTELDDVRTRRDISKALLDEAARELERTTIVAPIDGILNRLLMEIGEYASPGDAVAEIVDIRRVKVVADLSERDVYYFAVGDGVEVTPRAPGQPSLRGEITYISEVADPRARTTRMEVAIDNRDQVLRSGQIVTTRLTRRVLKDVVMIPLDSVIPLERGRVVYLVDDENAAQRRDVELGFIKGRGVQVLDGIEAGNRLIVAGHRYVGPGQPVTIIEQVALKQ